ncbi:MAG: peptide ABC transporter substrate-binding protein [Coriobacteriia bacterium]|nr:peptide ABC transporter substrate-binding protein [Coriobacteriia bacterium]
MHRYLKKTAAVMLSVIMVVALAGVAGCAPSTSTSGGTSSTASGPVKGGMLSFYIGEPEAIDPFNAQESEGVQVTQSLFDSLTAVNPTTGKVIPAAADSWSSDASATVWTFKLHPGAKFADGEPVTAADFVYAWNRIAESASKDATNPSQISYHLSPVVGYDEANSKGTPMSGVKAIDDTTLQVTLQYPFADWPYVCSHPALAPVPQKLVENGVPYNGKTVPFDQMPVGNGPFKMSAPWVHNQYIKVVRNDDYYGTKAHLDGVDFKIFADLDTAYREFEAGSLDFTQIPSGQVAAAKQKYGVAADGYTVDPGHGVLLGPEAAIYYLSFDMKKAPLDNLNVRKAISLAINRDAINQAVFEGTRKAAGSYVPPGIPGYEDNQFQFSHYDIAAAKQALVDAGYPGGKGLPTLELAYNSGAGHAQVMALVQSDLKAIGVNTKTYTLQGAQYWPYLTTTKFQVARDGWIADYPIIDNFTNPIFNSTADNNHSHYSNPQVDAMILKARSTTDEAARIALYQQIQKMVGDDAPVAPIVYYAHNRVGANRVNNLFYDNMGLAHFDIAWLTGGGK